MLLREFKFDARKAERRSMWGNRWTVFVSLIVGTEMLVRLSQAQTVDTSVPLVQNTVSPQMVDSFTPVANEVCLGQPFGTYKHPSDMACYIVCYGSNEPSETTDTIGHQRCCSEGLCYTAPSEAEAASCGACSLQDTAYDTLYLALSGTCLGPLS